MISDINIRIDRNSCIACGTCVDRCIMDNLRLSVAPCRQACPLDINCQGYVRLIAMGKEEEAAEELRKHTPFSQILGRICSRPCEAACERGKTIGDGPVQVRALKRYLDERYPDVTGRRPEIMAETGLSAAVIGSGPAGLMAAYELRSMGHKVTVYDSSDKPGGLLRHGLPRFRLPVREVEEAVDLLRDMGVEFVTECAIGRDMELAQLEKEHGAIVIATGAGPSMRLNVPGADLEQVVSGLDILAKAASGGLEDFTYKRVAVIGGGNSAVDTAITCVHAGAREVVMVCLENPNEMPAFEQELREARELGVRVENCWGVGGIEKTDAGSVRLSFNRCLTVFDPEGNFAPQIDETCGLHSLETDLAAVAIGHSPDVCGLPEYLFDMQAGRFSCDPVTRQAPENEKVFIAGDCASGPSSVVEAFASGKEAGISAGRYLSGEGLWYERDRYEAGGLSRRYEVIAERAAGGARGESPCLPVEKRGLDAETELVLDPEQAKREAERCLSCGRSFESNMTCWYCLPCEIECPYQALEVRMPYQVR